MNRITPEDPQAQSADVIAENVERLRELFPEAFTEGRIDFDVLKQLLSGALEERDEKYGLNWHGKRRARQLALTPSTGTLRPCPEESVDWDSTKNLMIEGDNLEVLKLLQKSYSGKVKLIYIDPPYNTGRDFVYPDDFRDSIQNYLQLTGQLDGENAKVSSNAESSGRFHTDWLCMMFPRLKLARHLLSDDGVMFISIDESEVANLIAICNEIFGEENFVGIFKWNNTSKAPTLSKKIRGKYEYVVCYEKLDVIKLRGPDSYNKMAPLFNSGNRASRRSFPPQAVEFQFSDRTLSAGTYGEGEKAVQLHGDIEVVGGANESAFEMTARFKWSQETLNSRLEQGQRVAFKTPKLTTMYYYLDGDGEEKYIAPSDLLNKEESGVLRNDEGHEELKRLFGGVTVFDYAKPTSLPKYLARMADDQEAICMDFFAGACTTAHALMELNAEDGGKRRHIMVQLPEECPQDSPAFQSGYATIAEIGKERLRRAAEALKQEHRDSPCDTGFRVFKLDHSNIRAWDPSPEDLDAALFDGVEHLREGRAEEDVLYELLLKLGLDLCVPIENRTIAGKTVHSIGAGALFVCLPSKIDPEDVEELALGIAGWREELDTAGETTVVFRDGAFADDVAKTNTSAILEQHGIENVRSL